MSFSKQYSDVPKLFGKNRIVSSSARPWLQVRRAMIHAIDIKTVITLILALTGLITTVFGLLNTLVKQSSEFLVRLLSATRKVVNAAKKLANDLRRVRSSAKEGPTCITPRGRRQVSHRRAPANARAPQQSLPRPSRKTASHR
jgi:hypothetical protein